MAEKDSLGVIIATEAMGSEALTNCARKLEAQGYESLWLPELFGREPVSTAGYLLGQTQKLKVATGIANVYVRDAHSMAQTRRTLAELSSGRFILGLGVSNPGLNGTRGHQWRAPLPTMRDYLNAMQEAQLDSPEPDHPAPLYIAAHGPKLQTLGAQQTDGIITYLMPPEHTAASRQHVGPDTEVTVVAPLLAEADPDTARRKARKALQYYVTLDYYHREWRKLGFTDEDFSNGGSNRLIDMLVGWGNESALQDRLTAYRDAGANRIVIMPWDLAREDGKDTLSVLAPSG